MQHKVTAIPFVRNEMDPWAFWSSYSLHLQRREADRHEARFHKLSFGHIPLNSKLKAWQQWAAKGPALVTSPSSLFDISQCDCFPYKAYTIMGASGLHSPPPAEKQTIPCVVDSSTTPWSGLSQFYNAVTNINPCKSCNSAQCIQILLINITHRRGIVLPSQ